MRINKYWGNWVNNWRLIANYSTRPSWVPSLLHVCAYDVPTQSIGLRSGPKQCPSSLFVHISRYFAFNSSKPSESDINYFCPPMFTLPVERVNGHRSNRTGKGLSRSLNRNFAFLALPVSRRPMHATPYSRHYAHRKTNNNTTTSPINISKKFKHHSTFFSPEGSPRTWIYV